MKLTNFLFVSLIFISFHITVYPATIKGVVTDSRTSEILTGANVVVLGKEIGCATDVHGFYEIKNLPPGKYIIRASFVVYGHIDNNVEIKDKDEVVELNIKLKSPTVDLDSVTTSEIEAYHKRLEEQNNISQILSIKFDSIEVTKSLPKAYFSVTNNAKDSFYIFKNYLCFQVITLLLENAKGDWIKQRLGVMDCVGEKTCPDETDLILLRPGETIKYPPTEVGLYNMSKRPKGKYTLAIEYEFKKPKTINTFYCGTKSNIKTLITGLRGTYISNAITFENK